MSTVRRTSTFSAAQIRTIIANLLADLPGVKADCTVDWFGGDKQCTLSVAAHVDVGLSLVLGTPPRPPPLCFTSLNKLSPLSLPSRRMAYYMRYRRRRAPHISTLPKRPAEPAEGNNGSGSAGPPNVPQYPSRVHSAVPTARTTPTQDLFPPAHSPPPYYTPPPGALPKGPYHGKGSFPI
ncbi:hypothetical protein EDB85DRAFT_2152585 [Lactarius pseudohatsudake]|nr:hypothetical protein EDB85DRAFT_2152585 [Lactarius pseudohatsudake]